MNKEDIAKLIEDHADIGKGEVAAVIIGLITTAIAIGRETKEKKYRVFLWALGIVVTVQCLMLLFILIYLV